jgi:hypothetical protein
MTPYVAWYHIKPFVAHYKKIGSLAYSFVNKEVRTKLQAEKIYQ